MVDVYVAKKHRHGPVVVFPRDGIEFVIVTPSAVNRESHEALKGRTDDVVQVFITVIGIVLLAKPHSGPDAVVTRGREAVEVPSLKLITGDLFENEPVERFVLVECFDYVVAVPPGIGKILVMLKARTVRIPNHVEPETAPALTIMRRRQQPFNQVFVSVRRRV